MKKRCVLLLLMLSAALLLCACAAPAEENTGGIKSTVTGIYAYIVDEDGTSYADKDTQRENDFVLEAGKEYILDVLPIFSGSQDVILRGENMTFFYDESILSLARKGDFGATFTLTANQKAENTLLSINLGEHTCGVFLTIE